MRRLIFPVLMGVIGVGILVALGVWQVQRLGQKEALIARIEAKIGAAPVAVPASPEPEADRYLAVTAEGRLTGREVHVLTSEGEPGYRVIAEIDTGDRRMMADLGFVPQADKDIARAAAPVTLTGNLHWPQETDRFTPPPDPANIWFARDVPAMAQALATEPVLIVVRSLEGADLGVQPLPIDGALVRNDHREYAITWFSLAVVWAVMSMFFVLRMARDGRKD